MGTATKTALLPAVRVGQEIRDDAEALLTKNESLSTFIERAVAEHITKRKIHREFLQRGYTAREEVRRTGVSYAANVVLDELEAIQAEAEARTVQASEATPSHIRANAGRKTTTKDRYKSKGKR